jgi:hypothetical protein
MFILVDEYRFVDTMTLNGNGFSYHGAKALYEWLTSGEENEIGQEFDPIGLRGDFSEYASAEEACRGFHLDVEVSDDLDDDAVEEEALRVLEREDILVDYEAGYYCIVRCV